MSPRNLALFLLLSIPASCASAQDARNMLQAVLGKYAGLRTYYAEGTREWTTHDEIQRDWRQEHFVVARAAGNKYRYDIKTPDGWNIVVADGTTEWTFQPWRNQYTRRPVPNLTDKAIGLDDAIRASSERLAQNYVEDLSASKVEKADFLPDETITVAGQQIACRVIRATYQKAEGFPAPQYTTQATFWLDKDRELVQKMSTVTRGPASTVQELREIETTQTTYYTSVDLQRSPADGLFSFSVPSGAKLVRRLFLSDSAVDLTGFAAPPLKLKTFEGRAFDPASVKGHAVLVEFWASWCVPCIQQMRSLAKLADDFGKKGLIVIGVNLDDDPNAALKFLSDNHYGWANLRDVNGETANSWKLNGVPLLAVIDPSETIAYYHSGYEQPVETALLEVLRKIYPAFARSGTSCQLAANALITAGDE
jgi:thiol-disulfide isomerase/thioredoxin